MTSKSALAVPVGLLIAAGAALAVGTARADVTRTSTANRCPSGFELLSVAALEATGPYVVPRRVDAAGNNNGFVCGLARPNSVRDAFCKQGGLNACRLAELGLPIYLVKDDDNPAGGH